MSDKYLDYTGLGYYDGKIKDVINAKYTKPSGGIPKTDLASAVQTSLGKADTALQSETYTGTITGITMNGTSKGTSGVVDLGTVVTDTSDKVDKAGDTMTGGLTTTNLTIGNRESNSTIGTNSIAVGDNNLASGQDSIALGSDCQASARSSIALGYGTPNKGKIKSSKAGALACGYVASVGLVSGGDITTQGFGSLAFGYTYGSDENSSGTIEATANGSIAMGYSKDYKIKASATGSIAMGCSTDDNGIISNGQGSIAMGNGSVTSSGKGSVALGGQGIAASAEYSFAASCGTNANGKYMTALGKFNKQGTSISGLTEQSTGDILIVGRGTGTETANRANAMRLTVAGKLYLLTTYASSGADYAETTEWVDGNPNDEDRVGRFVCMSGTKMRYATSQDNRSRIGVVSSIPAINGDSYSEEWKGKYKRDIFGRVLTQVVHHDAEYDEDGNLIEEAYDATEWILSDDYDPTQEYIPREERKEFDFFGMLGKLIVIDDGTCQVDGYCYPNDSGIATAESDINKGFYVMERLDSTHIRILLK